MKYYQGILLCVVFALATSWSFSDAATLPIYLNSTAKGCDITMDSKTVNTEGVPCTTLYPTISASADAVFPDDIIVIIVDGVEYQRA